jgi:hypothetical protein
MKTIHCFLLAGVLMSCKAAAEEPVSEFRDGVRLVRGKPFFSTAAFFGFNHWMSQVEEKGKGYVMHLPIERVGTAKDFHWLAGFNTGYYSIWPHEWLDGRAYDPALTKDAFRRAAKAKQEVILHLPSITPESVTKKLDMHWVTEEGTKVPFGRIWGIHHNPEIQAQAIRETYRDIFDVVRGESLNIGYQIGCERWAYDFIRVKKDVSFDEWSLEQFRKFLEKRFSLAEIGQRYGGKADFYASWSEVMPPISKKPQAFGGRALSNWDVARWDWYLFRDDANVDSWVAMIEEFQKLDGTGRPFSFEHNHGPYYAIGFHPFAEICARTKNFAVGNGDFTGDLAGTLSSIIQVKGCGEGPWINNELDAGTTDRHMDAAHQRRKVWGTTALGAGGYHLWTLHNLMGASSEFTNDTFYDPRLVSNLPPKFFEVLHANKMISSLGTKLAGSKSPAPRIALMLLDDSLFQNKFTNDYRPEGENFCRAMLNRGLADAMVMNTKWHLEETPMTGIEAIILPRMPRIVDSRAEKLADFVEKGGTLVLMGPTGRVNELFQEQKVSPFGKLGQAAGVRMKSLNANEVAAAPLTFDWNGRAVHFDVQVELEIPAGSKAEPILSAGGKVYAAKHRFGKGQVITLPGYPLVTTETDATAEFVGGLLLDAGVRPAVALSTADQRVPNVMAARRSGPEGTLVFLIENENQSHDLTVSLDPALMGLSANGTYSVFECFSDESHEVSPAKGWEFRTRLEPAGVRVFLVSQSPSREDVLPKKNQYLIPKNPDAILVKEASRGQPYLTGTAVAEAEAHQRSRTISMKTAASPSDLGNGYVALDLSPAMNAPLARMVQGLDSEQFVNFGNVETSGESGVALGFQEGPNKLGDVPFFSMGRCVAMGPVFRVEGIPVGKPLESLHFFAGTQHSQGHSTLGSYRINYADGTHFEIPLVLNVTLSDFTRGSWWKGKTKVFHTIKDSKGKAINFQRFDWRNPYPEKVVESVDLLTIPSGDTRPVSLWAITGKSKS